MIDERETQTLILFEDSQPKVGRKVLAYDGFQYAVGEYSPVTDHKGRVLHTVIRDNEFRFYADYWFPLPKPPIVG